MKIVYKNTGKPVLFVLILLPFISSCHPILLPNTLAPANTYKAGKGEIGIRSIYYIPQGADFKLGITDNIQLSGVAYPDIYEGSLQINTSNTGVNKYLHIFSIGGGVYLGNTSSNCSTNNSGETCLQVSGGQTNYIYEGYYPGFRLSSRISVSLPLRLYEFIGRYNYIGIGTTMPATLEKYRGAAFIPEMDWSFDWEYVGLRIGISMPIQFWESANPEPLWILPMASAGLYYKW